MIKWKHNWGLVTGEWWEGAEFRTVDPLALFHAKHGDSLSNVGGVSDALERAHVGKALVNDIHGHALVAARDVVPRVLVVHVGLDAARGDGVDSHLLLAAVNGEGSGETLDGGLGAGIEGMVVNASHGGGDGRSEDNAASAAAVLETLLGDEELASAVEVEDAVKELLGDIELGRPDLSTRVGDHELNVTVVGHNAVKEAGNLGGLADVGLDGDGIGAKGLELGNGVLSGLGARAVVDNNVAAALGKLEGDALANTAAGTGDNGDLAGERLTGVDRSVDNGGVASSGGGRAAEVGELVEGVVESSDGRHLVFEV